MRPHCPMCDAPCDDDGDRYYADQCFECGWMTEYRRARNAETDAKLARWRELSQGTPDKL